MMQGNGPGDYYSTLGVTPASEEVVIHATYRALMRRYHPDMKPGPDGERRVREITEAYATLRDPEKRAEYDQRLSEKDPLLAFEMDQPAQPPVRPPPAGRNASLAAIGLAGLAVIFVWNTPRIIPAQAPPPVIAAEVSQANNPPVTVERAPAAAPASPSVRPPRYDRDLPPPAPAVATPANLDPPPLALVEARSRPAPPKPETRTAMASMPAPAPARAAPPAAIRPARNEAPAACAGMQCTSERLAALEIHQQLLYNQSFGSADEPRRIKLSAARDHLLVRRSACRSESCVAGAYLDHFKSVTAIMEDRTGQP